MSVWTALLCRVGIACPFAIRPGWIDGAIGFRRDPSGFDGFANSRIRHTAFAGVSAYRDTHSEPAEVIEE
jgi:hypothetical protein